MNRDTQTTKAQHCFKCGHETFIKWIVGWYCQNCGFDEAPPTKKATCNTCKTVTDFVHKRSAPGYAPVRFWRCSVCNEKESPDLA